MIPQMNAAHFLPPFLGHNPGQRLWTSPYPASISEVVERFATSPARVILLHGLLSYRDALRAAGLSEGYQWLDGSFVEDIEWQQHRPPRDIDMVTFASSPADPPARQAWFAAHGDLCNRHKMRRRFMCEAYFVDLRRRAEVVVIDACYLYGLFSHQGRDLHWKGMLQIPLISDDDAAQFQLHAIARQLEVKNA